jgi:uncharacterized protein YndB with AHSA1/START domain
MTNLNAGYITVKETVNAPIEIVWRIWSDPIHITQWNNASEDWHTPKAENDLKTGGKFTFTMAARDGSMSFDFGGTYTEVKKHEFMEYVLEDNRKVNIQFLAKGNSTEIIENFEPESENTLELQEMGWQAILTNFKNYTEELQRIETLHYEINIDKPASVVYNTMLAEDTYKLWTAIFNETSHYRGSWEKGSKILFIGTDENGIEGGMVSRIKENVKNEFISIEHLGEFVNGEEQLNKPWAGSLENYTFREFNGKTHLSVDVDSNQEFKSYFEGMWPDALLKLKEICEA